MTVEDMVALKAKVSAYRLARKIAIEEGAHSVVERIDNILGALREKYGHQTLAFQ